MRHNLDLYLPKRHKTPPNTLSCNFQTTEIMSEKRSRRFA